MKKKLPLRRLFSVLLAAMMLAALVPTSLTASAVKAAKDGDTIYLYVGDWLHDNESIQAAISDATDGKTTEIGLYESTVHHYMQLGTPVNLSRYVDVWTSDKNVITVGGRADSKGTATVKIYLQDWCLDGTVDETYDIVTVNVVVRNRTIGAAAVTDIEAPVVGKPFDFTGKCDAKGVESVKVWWRNNTDHVDVTKDDVAEAGKVYQVNVDLTPKKGCLFSGYSTAIATINGKDAPVCGGGIDSLSIYYIFPPATTVISNITVKNVIVPAAGEHLSRNCTLGEGYSLHSFGWYDIEADRWLKDADTFELGKDYRAVIHFKPDEGYSFAKSTDMTASINGETATEGVLVSGNDVSYRALRSIFTCYAKPEITKQPEKAETTVGMPMTFSVTAENAEKYFWHVGNLSASSGTVTSTYFDSVFEAHAILSGKNSPTITVTPTDTFLDGKVISCLVKGKAGEVSSRWVKISVSEPPKEISSVEITDLDSLVHGKAADYTASTPTKGCSVTKIEYQMFKKILTDYVPVNGDNIAVVVTVKAEEGYVFASGSTATWNGIKSDGTFLGLEGDERRYCFYLEVGVDESQLVKELTMTVTAPKVGEVPAKTAEVGEGTKLESLTWEPADETFKEGVVYTVTGYIWQDDTHVFSTDYIIENQSGTVNGNQGVVTKPASTGGGKDKFMKGIYLSYTFPKVTSPDEELSEVEVTGIDTPVIGKKPDTSAKTSSGCAIEKIMWDDGEGELSEGDVFEAGKTYSVMIELSSAEGMAFTEDTEAALDGKTAETYFSAENPHTLTVVYAFPTIAPVKEEKPEKPEEPEEPEEEYKFPFTDVADSAWYRKDVEIAHKNGLVNGKSATRFYPDDNMTYAEAVKLACAMHQLYYDKKVTLTSGETVWYSIYMEYALEKGIIDKDLTPIANEKITRRDFVKIFYAALPDSEYEVMNEVADGAIPDVAKNDESSKQIYAFYRAGILTGSDGYGNFYPKNNIVRREVAAILTRMFDADARKAITLK